MDQNSGYELESTLEEPSVTHLDNNGPLGSSIDAPQTGQKKSQLPKRAIIIVSAVIMLGLLAFVAIASQKKPAAKPVAPTPIVINTQSLDNGTLNKLTNPASPSETKQQLTIAPDTLFKSDVQIQGSLKTEKNLDVGGNLAIKGTTSLQGAVGINSNLAVRGSLSVGGVISAGSLNVGSLGVSTINISGSLNFVGHIVPGGARPSVKPSAATNGGSITIDGNDTAGTITINIGSGAVIPGELVIINFRSAFAGTPKVQLTPINSEASALNYYATRSPTFFTIETSSPPTAGASYVFDYLITQ